MIYGINFNRTHIPEEALAVLPTVIKQMGISYELKGVCNSLAELTEMRITANNGHRLLYTQESGKWFGVYVG
jgi:hypothetical protein